MQRPAKRKRCVNVFTNNHAASVADDHDDINVNNGNANRPLDEHESSSCSSTCSCDDDNMAAIVWMNHNEMQSALKFHSIAAQSPPVEANGEVRNHRQQQEEETITTNNNNNNINTETSLPLLLQSFVLDHPRLNQLVQPPAGTLRRNVRRESAESFQGLTKTTWHCCRLQPQNTR